MNMDRASRGRLGFKWDAYHLIFTAAWQARVREQDRAAAEERLLREHLGDHDYDKTVSLREWIDTHPKRPMILAFLNGSDE